MHVLLQKCKKEVNKKHIGKVAQVIGEKVSAKGFDCYIVMIDAKYKHLWVKDYCCKVDDNVLPLIKQTAQEAK